MLPKDFPPWQTVYWWFRRFVGRLLFRTIHDVAPMLDRARDGREESPRAGIVDSRSVKAPSAEQRGLDAAAYRDFVLEIVRRTDAEPGFKVLPRRWVVERTFGWMTRWRRLVRDCEQHLDVSEAMIHAALGSLLLRRIAHP